MSEHRSWRKESRDDWGTKCDPGQYPSTEQLKVGAIMRIADAAELMAKNYQQLIDQREGFKRMYEGACARVRVLERRLAAAKGQITRLKKVQSEKVA